MLGDTTLTEILGLGALGLFGAYIHYRVSVRRTQTRLAICMLEDDDSLLVHELERMVKAGKVTKLSKKHASASVKRKPSVSSPPAPEIVAAAPLASSRPQNKFPVKGKSASMSQPAIPPATVIEA